MLEIISCKKRRQGGGIGFIAALKRRGIWEAGRYTVVVSSARWYNEPKFLHSTLPMLLYLLYSGGPFFRLSRITYNPISRRGPRSFLGAGKGTPLRKKAWTSFFVMVQRVRAKRVMGREKGGRTRSLFFLEGGQVPAPQQLVGGEGGATLTHTPPSPSQSAGP